MQAAEAGGEEIVGPGGRRDDGERAGGHEKQRPMTGTMETEYAPPVMMPAP